MRLACLVSLLAVAGAAPTCATGNGKQGIEAPRLRVALRSDVVRSGSPERHMVAGDRFGLVRFDPRPAVTLHTVPAARAVADFKRALASGTQPAASAEVDLHLPLPPDVTRDLFVDVVFFEDRNGNGQWDEDEPFVSAWNGGMGSYRAYFLTDARSDLAGSDAGWNLCEGGQPITCTTDLASTVIHINPLVEPVAAVGQWPMTKGQ